MLFSADAYDLPGTGGATLQQMTAADATPLAIACAAIDPWLTYGTSADDLTRYFTPQAGSVQRLKACDASGHAVGLVIIRWPWLHGPYVTFLAVLPDHQGHGIGMSMLGAIEREARATQQRNLWLCVSHFNLGAQTFYTRAGFEQAALLPDLVRDGVDEVLMRKRLV